MVSSILDSATIKITNAATYQELEQIRIEFAGKNGLISEQMKLLASLPDDQKKSFGAEINEIRKKFESLLDAKKLQLKEKELNEKLEKEKIDITLPARIRKTGAIHPISQAKTELVEIFAHLGFEVKEGPSVESDWYNFTALNIDENHPARQDHDTFYVGSTENRKVLRTHTSPVQIRTMQSGTPPFRFIAPGRTYRSDYDQTHTPMFHQIELLAVDKNITMNNLKYVIEEFIAAFFEGQNPELRFRPSFFPFTTPSAEVDIRFAGGKWLEVLGCGMIHPNVLKNANIDPNQYQGFAAGLGIERMAMLKYGINDLREFFESDIRWLKHYSFSELDIPSIISGLTR
jgi:phenylalanyl-tRNA synthetase alpha chain